MTDKQKLALYWDLYQEITTSYKFIDQNKQNFIEDKKSREKKHKNGRGSQNGLSSNDGSDEERPLSLMVKRKDTQEDLQDIEYPKMEKLPVPQPPRGSRSSSIRSETEDLNIEAAQRIENDLKEVSQAVAELSNQPVTNDLE